MIITIDTGTLPNCPLPNRNQPENWKLAEQIVQAVAASHDMPIETLLSPRRDEPTAWARMLAAYLLREVAGMRFQSIAILLRRKDHTAALYQHKQVQNRIATEPAMKKTVNQWLAAFAVK